MSVIAITANTSWYIYNFRRNTIRALTNQGHTVLVLSPKDVYTALIEELGVLWFDINIDQGGVNPFHDLKTLLEFFCFFKKNHVDVVLNFTPKNNIYSSIAARCNGVKVINNIAGLGNSFFYKKIVSVIIRLLYKFSQRFANKIFFQNSDDRHVFLSNQIVPEGITELVPGSGVDLSRFVVTNSMNDGVVRFLLVARMLIDKGVLHYVDAARILKQKYGTQVEFQLLGFVDVSNPSAISVDEIQQWVDDDLVNYLGVSNQVESIMSQADCIVLPSFYREGVPKSLLEAAALGKPIVTTDNVGCRETVDHGVNGFLCEPRSTNSLVAMLENIISLTHEARLTMGLASRAKVEREFDEKIVIDKYLAAIEECLKIN